MFRGSAPAKIDDKGRLKIPTDFRRVIEERYGPDLFVTSIEGDSALLYPLPVWEEIEARLGGMPSTDQVKARFLERMLAEFELHGEVVAQRAELAAHEPRLRDAFMTGTARAVSSAPTVAELLLPFIAPGGAALLQRGTLEERERVALEDAAVVLNGSVERYIALDGAADRRIAVVRKTGATPNRFPRRTGIPEKRPLCL